MTRRQLVTRALGAIGAAALAPLAKLLPTREAAALEVDAIVADVTRPARAFKESLGPEWSPPAPINPCSCVRPIIGSWTDIGSDRIALYSPKGFSSGKYCVHCYGTGRPRTKLLAVAWASFAAPTRPGRNA